MTTKQRDTLLDAYRENRYPKTKRIVELANCLGLTELKVRTWFQNRRAIANKLRAANLLQAKIEEFNPQEIKVGIKMEPMDVGLGNVQWIR